MSQINIETDMKVKFDSHLGNALSNSALVIVAVVHAKRILLVTHTCWHCQQSAAEISNTFRLESLCAKKYLILAYHSVQIPAPGRHPGARE